MTYQSVWWYPNYVEYGTGLNPPKTWPKVQEQYRRPHALYDLRYYDLPVDEYQAKLYYNLPKLGKPAYRATFRDKPHTVAKHYPDVSPEGKPLGFYGRAYYEDGPPAFKYEGPRRDKLYWVERPPFLPTFSKDRASSSKERAFETTRGLNLLPQPPSEKNGAATHSQSAYRTTNAAYGAFTSGSRSTSAGTGHRHTVANPTKRLTQDGVGYL